MRKAVGGSRRQLIQQFITENVLMCTFSLALAVVIARVFLVPILNSIFILQIELDLLSNPLLWVFLAALLITVAFVSGAYPAFYVSSFETVSIFRGRRLLGQNDWLTRAFLTFQFVLAFVTVILGVALTMNSRYLIKQDWGYDPANKIVVELTEARQFGPLRDRLVRHPHVISVVGASDHVGRGLNTIEVQDPDGESTRVASYKVGPGYIETLGLNLTRGRLLEAARPSDLTDAVVVNQKFVQSHGWSEPLGQIVRVDDHRYSVVGVVEDFSFFFLAEPMPTILTAASAENFGYLIIGVDGSIDEVKNQVASVWTELYPNSVLREFSQADVFDDTYTQYNRITRVFSYLAGLALLIACMGLFGLASQSLARRVKEFGIRKVVGATVSQLAILANRSFLIMLVLSATVATAICVIGLNVVLSVVRDIVPIAHMPITPLPFSIAYGLVFSAAAIAVGVHLLKLRRTNPAEVLRVP
jgi:ABC-type antimicrobial peptide transport system permease subunit